MKNDRYEKNPNEINRFEVGNSDPRKDVWNYERKKDVRQTSVKGFGYIVFLTIVFIASYFLFSQYWFAK